ncbi:hypothetical protein LS74_001200 [Helicobacter magdeburgensis]|uniref:Uncharacterized protein n=1 Tax=Helicobacter magdeburgensis TaxID=471858 RepID=A0A4U8T1V3_9HELI|nr:hypothetical protein [Helicobacter magdeburgensis]TLD93376.1 hypothetical protein LS74_001200 [Helicobacter magdeburgensis]
MKKLSLSVILILSISSTLLSASEVKQAFEAIQTNADASNATRTQPEVGLSDNAPDELVEQQLQNNQAPANSSNDVKENEANEKINEPNLPLQEKDLEADEPQAQEPQTNQVNETKTNEPQQAQTNEENKPEPEVKEESQAVQEQPKQEESQAVQEPNNQEVAPQQTTQESAEQPTAEKKAEDEISVSSKIRFLREKNQKQEDTLEKEQRQKEDDANLTSAERMDKKLQESLDNIQEILDEKQKQKE